MRACRTASIVAFGALFTAGAIGACREPAPPTVPPLTTAQPASATRTALPLPTVADAGANAAALPSASASPPPVGTSANIVEFLETSKTVPLPKCGRVFVVAAKGMIAVGSDTLRAGDVLVLSFPERPIDVKANGLAVTVIEPLPCGGASSKAVVRAKDAADLRFAGGAMHAHLDVGAKVSPELYLGRLDGTAPVAEHEHATSAETLIAIEGAGTFTINGEEHRLAPRSVVVIPMKAKHSWKPDPGTKLVAIQMYEPPGPEQRFVALAAAEKDAGK